MAKVRYRLALDIGTNSIGWCVYRLADSGEPQGILRLGSRIFSDGRNPKNLASLAQDRRVARQARRRRDRVLKRRKRLVEGLVRYGLLPNSAEARKELLDLDPYVLRARALDERLTPEEIGRALFHLARKRGFRSSRKDRGDSDKEKELGKVKEAIAQLRERVAAAGCRTVGEYLARQHSDRHPVRARRSTDGGYVLYLQRAMVQEEFEKIWAAQKSHHASLLTDEAHDHLLDTLLFQRRLKPVSPGRCLFEPNEFRARLCSPLQQRFRILQELNHLRLICPEGERRLTLTERDLLAATLRTQRELTFAHARRLLGIGRNDPTRFNLESAKRSKLKGDIVCSQLASPEAIGDEWHRWEESKQQALAELVEATDDEGELIQSLTATPWNLPMERATVVSRCRLPEDFGSLSLKALRRIVPELEKDVVNYDEAVRRAGYDDHSNFYTGESFPRLPYYGEILRGYTSPTENARDPDEAQFGKIPNPTVHIGLNQLRQLINALLGRYGHPEQVVIELTREFGASGERRRDIERQQAENQTRNQQLDEQLVSLGRRATRENRIKLMLWEELGRDDAMDRRCVYSGRQLSAAMLFSDEVEIDHVLPFSRSLHDGTGNKVLCTRQANRDKGNRTPYEAFGHSPGAYKWNGIVDRAAHLPGRKPLLFQPEALEQFLDGREFLERQLIDTGYLGRAAKQYLSAVCPPDNIWVTTGRITGLLRARWRLASLLWDDSRKNRYDHRHHALDAAVIGLCSRSLVQRLATAAARAEERGESRLLERLDLPWPGYREELQACLEKVVVSHKPDHGREAQLHNDTNYGWRGEPDSRGTPLVGRRVPIESLTSVASLEGIADARIKVRLADLLAPLSGGRAIAAALRGFSDLTGIRRVLKEERLSVIPIADRRSGQTYRYVKGDSNYCCEIFRKPDGSWDGTIISTFEANRPDFRPDRRVATNGMPLVMRLHAGDMISVADSGRRRIMRVVRITEGKITLAEHFEANEDARDRNKSDAFKLVSKSPGALRRVAARPVGVCTLGYVNERHIGD